jgi:hypothetical protein
MTEVHDEGLGSAVSSSVCPYYLGFLGQRPKGSAIPDECLACEKILDCMVPKPQDIAAKPEVESEFSAVQRAEDLAEELGEKDKKEKLEEEEVRHGEVDESIKRTSSDDFTVESPGMLYAHWSSTVLIRKETLRSWGKVKGVDIEAGKGKKTTCKVYPVEDLETGVIQVPDEMQLKLGVKKGGIVKVKPKVKR